MIAVLATVLLAAHLLAINIAAAGPLVWAWLVVRGGGSDARSSDRARRMARCSLACLCLGIALGTALLAAPNPGLRAALVRFPASTYWFAGGELLFSAVWMAIAILPVRPGVARRPWLAWFLALVTSSNLLYHFPPLMGVLGKLASNSEWAAEGTIDHRTMLRLAARPEVLALWAHFVLASIAVAAIAALWPARGEITGAPSGQAADNDRTSRRLAGAALVASLLQLPVGVWVLLSSSGPARGALMGNDALTSGLFVAGIVAALALFHNLGAIALGEVEPTMRRRAAWLLAAVALLMSATLTLSRRAGDSATHSTGSAAPETARTAATSSLPPVPL